MFFISFRAIMAMKVKSYIGLLKSLLYTTEMILDGDDNPDLSYTGMYIY